MRVEVERPEHMYYYCKGEEASARTAAAASVRPVVRVVVDSEDDDACDEMVAPAMALVDSDDDDHDYEGDEAVGD